MGKFLEKNPQNYPSEYADNVSMRKYFSDLALGYLSLIKLHKKSGHLPSLKNLSPEQKSRNMELSGQEDWSNVVRHCLAEAGAADALAELLNLSEEDREILIQAAILHDYDKRVEIQKLKAGQGSQTEEVEKIKKISREVLLDNGIAVEIVEIIDKIGDVDINSEQGITLLQKVLFYIDNITSGTDLVAIQAKYDMLLQRYPKLAAEGYYDKWVSSTREVQTELAKMIGLQNPDELPTVIMQKVKQLAEKKSQKVNTRNRADIVQKENSETWEKFSPDVRLSAEVAKLAGDEAMESLKNFSESDVTVKTADNVGTIMAYTTPGDVVSQKTIFSKMSGANPETRFLMEEKTDSPNAKILNGLNYPEILKGTAYIVDPIDGTREYKNGGDQWSVVIGKLQDGKLVGGTILAPRFGLQVTGEKTKGLIIEDKHPGRKFANIVTGQDLYELTEFTNFMDSIQGGQTQKTIKKTGSGALGFALVAAGKADVCIQPHQFPWDYAAGAALVEAAGGKVIFYHYRQGKLVRMDELDEESFNPKTRRTGVIASLGKEAEEQFLKLEQLWQHKTTS